ncbi:MAG: hypothetical protein EDM72_15290 [Chlorobiota bacterium]|nr:MAG: hypothetical protein EDM72_15290 [Chlorobiota bacterium]
MSDLLFTLVLKNIALPIVFFLILKSSILDDENSFLAVVLTLTIVNIIQVLLQSIRILTNSMMMKGRKVTRLLIAIVIELVSVLGFWYYYLAKFN